MEFIEYSLSGYDGDIAFYIFAIPYNRMNFIVAVMF